MLKTLRRNGLRGIRQTIPRLLCRHSPPNSSLPVKVLSPAMSFPTWTSQTGKCFFALQNICFPEVTFLRHFPSSFTSLVKLPSDGIDNIAYGRTASCRSMLTKFSSLYCFWASSNQNIPRWGLSVKIVSLLHTIRLHSLIHTFSVYCYCASNVKRYAEKWHCDEWKFEYIS